MRWISCKTNSRSPRSFRLGYEALASLVVKEVQSAGQMRHRQMMSRYAKTLQIWYGECFNSMLGLRDDRSFFDCGLVGLKPCCLAVRRKWPSIMAICPKANAGQESVAFKSREPR